MFLRKGLLPGTRANVDVLLVKALAYMLKNDNGSSKNIIRNPCQTILLLYLSYLFDLYFK